jgi:hypothetical protein
MGAVAVVGAVVLACICPSARPASAIGGPERPGKLQYYAPTGPTVTVYDWGCNVNVQIGAYAGAGDMINVLKAKFNLYPYWTHGSPQAFQNGFIYQTSGWFRSAYFTPNDGLNRNLKFGMNFHLFRGQGYGINVVLKGGRPGAWRLDRRVAYDFGQVICPDISIDEEVNPTPTNPPPAPKPYYPPNQPPGHHEIGG